MIPAMPMGRLTKKIQRQPTYSTSKPPSTGPMAGASTVTRRRMRRGPGRSIGGKARKSMAVPTGVSMPPPTPCRTRKAISDPMLQARPHSTEAG